MNIGEGDLDVPNFAPVKIMKTFKSNSKKESTKMYKIQLLYSNVNLI